MSLRPSVFTHAYNAPEIHFPAPAATAADDEHRRIADPLR
jgi:hypothetical protein